MSIPALDGFALAATLFGMQGDRVLLVSSATAVPRQFYRRFAQHAQEQGYMVVTYDYRGVGGSRPASLRSFDARMRDWGLLDMTGVLAWISHELAPKSLHMIGHSAGGQLPGLAENAGLINKLVTLSAQSGYWRVQGGTRSSVCVS